MPRRLNRKEYGWSYSFGVGQRIPSDKYKENFDKIKWPHRDISNWEDGRRTVFGKAKKKVFK